MAVPGVETLAGVCLAPTLTGFWKSEYGVSYAYGTAMLATGSLILRSSPASPMAACQAAIIAAYGLRLNLFLLWRELTIPRFREFREKIEDRAKERGSRLSRAPFVLSCSALYLGMAGPMVLTSSAPALGPLAPFLVAVMFTGFFVAAWGDFTKSFVKAKKGSEALVTSGPFAALRHPNCESYVL